MTPDSERQAARGGALALAEIQGLLKPTTFWTRRVDNRLGACVAWLSLRLGVSARALTVSTFACALAAVAGLLVLPFPWGLVVFGVAAQLGYVIDGADGLVARATGSASQYGAYLDQVVDFCCLAVIGTGYTVYCGGRFASSPWVMGGCVTFFVTHALCYAADFLGTQLRRPGPAARRPAAARLLGQLVDTGLWWFLLPLLSLTRHGWVPLGLVSLLQAGYVARKVRSAYRAAGPAPEDGP